MDICPCFCDFFCGHITSMFFVFGSDPMEPVLLVLQNLSDLGTSIYLHLVDFVVDNVLFKVQGFYEF